MLSHVSPGRMFPAPLLIFNEARKSIMQMSLNGAWTSPSSKAGSAVNFPLPPPCLLFYCNCLLFLSSSASNLSVSLPSPFLFNFPLNAFPYFLISSSTHPCVCFSSPSSSSHSPFPNARLCHWSPLQTCWLIRRWIGPSWCKDEIHCRQSALNYHLLRRGKERQRKHEQWRERNERKGVMWRIRRISDGISRAIPELRLMKRRSTLHI